MMAIMMATAASDSLTDVTTTVLISAADARDAMTVANNQAGVYRRPGTE